MDLHEWESISLDESSSIYGTFSDEMSNFYYDHVRENECLECLYLCLCCWFIEPKLI